MSSYMLYATVIPKLLGVIGFIGTACFVLLFTFTFAFTDVTNHINKCCVCVKSAIFICCFIAAFIMIIIDGYSGSKCRTIINAKLEAKYDDYTILSNDKDINILEDKFEFSSNDIK